MSVLQLGHRSWKCNPEFELLLASPEGLFLFLGLWDKGAASRRGLALSPTCLIRGKVVSNIWDAVAEAAIVTGYASARYGG